MDEQSPHSRREAPTQRPSIPRAWEKSAPSWPRRGRVELRGPSGRALRVFGEAREAYDYLAEIVQRADFDIALYADPPIAPARAVALYWLGPGDGPMLVDTFDTHAAAELAADAGAERHFDRAKHWDGDLRLAHVRERFRLEPPSAPSPQLDA